MALDFIILGLPRSGTTWASNWLTNESLFCMHDPLWTLHYDDIDAEVAKRAGDRMAGVCCTALWRWPEWLGRHPARKLVLRRDFAEVAGSLKRIGFPPLPRDAVTSLDKVEGRHVPWTDLFKPERAEELWRWLTGGTIEFDAQRHAELVQHDVQPRVAAVKRDWRLNKRLGEEIVAQHRGGRKWQYL